MSMTIPDTYEFLLRVAIPEISDNSRLPIELRWERGKKEIRETEPGYNKKKLVWECISRAHLDVLSGRFQLGNYLSENVDAKTGLNKFALTLYQEITTNTKNKEINSKDLIDRVLKEDNARIGPTQKLVNLTLKYMFLLQTYGILQGFSIDEHKCDCPLDSIILRNVGRTENKWTNDFMIKETDNGYEIYENIQEQIQIIQKNKSRLAYDFKHWQRFPDT